MRFQAGQIKSYDDNIVHQLMKFIMCLLHLLTFEPIWHDILHSFSYVYINITENKKERKNKKLMK